LKHSYWSSPSFRAGALQAGFLIALIVLLAAAALDLRANMEVRGIPTGFGFLDDVAGFDINQSLISYSATSTYGRAFLIGLLNTGLVAVLGLFVATFVGFTVGIARLSKNWLIAQMASVYIEILRNLPLLLQLLFWYNAVLRSLPLPGDSFALPLSIYLNNRGLYVPRPELGPGAGPFVAALLFGLIAAFLFDLFARKSALENFRGPIRAVVLGLLILLPPVLTSFAAGLPLALDYPELQKFNFDGGLRLSPELVTLVLGLGLYTAAFIAEVVRAGIQSVPKGQIEAAAALGLSPVKALRLIIVPQAMRVIVPLLTSQYLNLVKNSSLAVFIGYPDLVQVFAGTVLNQTGAAVQVMFMTMSVYLAISLVTSLAMNLYHRRFTLGH
jgi:general L-amino acid transport system permease protein